MIPAHRFDHLHGAAREAAIEQADAAERAELERHSGVFQTLALHAALALLGRRPSSACTAVQRAKLDVLVRALGAADLPAAEWADLFRCEAAAIMAEPVPSAPRPNRAERRAAARRAAR